MKLLNEVYYSDEHWKDNPDEAPVNRNIQQHSVEEVLRRVLMDIANVLHRDDTLSPETRKRLEEAKKGAWKFLQTGYQ